nr:MAG TPA: hypothetical protein [Caudoviricetes sp.]
MRPKRAGRRRRSNRHCRSCGWLRREDAACSRGRAAERARRGSPGIAWNGCDLRRSCRRIHRPGRCAWLEKRKCSTP